MRALTKKAIKDVTRRKLRTTLTVLGIAIGVMGLTAINLASTQLHSSLAYSSDTSGEPDIQLTTAPTDASVAATLQQQPNVKLVQAESIAPTRWVIPSGHEPLTIIGLADFHNVQFNKFQLVSGNLPGPNEIMLESSARSVQNFNVGDQIEVDTGGAEQHLRISGLSRTQGIASPAFSGQAVAYMSQDSLNALFQVSGVNSFLVRLDDYSQRNETAKQLAQVLQEQQVVVLNVTVGHLADSGGTSTIDGIFGVMQALSIVALVLSIFLLLSTVTTLVTEQVPVIGTMKAVGARRGQVLRNYLTSVAIYGVAGTVIGLALGGLLGVVLVNVFAGLVTLDVGPLTISPSLVIVSLIVGIGVPLLAALLPLFLGTRITVHQALSGYGLESGQRGRGWAKAIGRVFGFVPQTMQLGARSLFRRRTRASLTLLALAVAGAAFLCVQTTSSSFDTVLNQVFSAYHADVFVSLSNPVSYSQLKPELAGVPGVSQTEPLDFIGIQTQWGSGLLTSVQPDSQLYQKDIVGGRWFTADDQNALLISTVTAAKTGLKVGDTISFHTSLYSATWQIIGLVQDYNNPTGIGTMLTSMSNANTFLHLPADYAQLLMVSSTSKNQADIDALASRVDDTLNSFRTPATVETAQQLIQRNQSQFLILYVLFYSVVVIIALVGAIGLFNALAMSVLERRREIGILRSMGATSRKVAQVFWTEGVSLGVVAWLVAIVLGIPLAYGFVALLGQLLFTVPFSFNPMSLVLMLIFIVVVATLASIGPVWGASRVKIAQTLRYE
jgi:putative ABC transport system permease protein